MKTVRAILRRDRAGRPKGARRLLFMLMPLAIVAALLNPFFARQQAEAAGGAAAKDAEFDQNKKRVPDFDVNQVKLAARLPSAAQVRALEALKSNLGDRSVTARWDKSTGSLDILYDFASAPSQADPESAARSFIQANGALFGLTDAGTLRLKSNVEALGGNLLYFEQVHAGLPVASGGVGVVMDGERRVRAVSGPYYPNLSVAATPSLGGAAAVAAAQADLAKFKVEWSSAVAGVMNPAMDALAAELGPVATPRPELNVMPTPAGPRLAYTFVLFSRNPFGIFRYQVDARSGEILYRVDGVNYQNPLPYTADIYPSSPVLKNPDTGELDTDDEGEPKGLLRVNLRNYNPGTNATAVEGMMSGPNALVRSMLATKQPFAQAALGTFHFRQNNPPLEAQPNEADDLAEPAQHIDMVNNFFFVNYLMEYVKHLHVAGDRAHSTFGTGHFPDTFPNSDKPLVGLVHFPSDQGAAGLSGPLDTSSPDAALRSALGMDNAFSYSQTVGGQTVNPTAYGHGYVFNDLAKDGPVVYHEGMHSISSPIAGLANVPEGRALNEAQGDIWAYTITDDEVLGNYIVNSPIRRARARQAGANPDLRQWFRHADSGLSYSQLGTYRGTSFEEHRDGEIAAAAWWDIRELLLMYQQGGPYKRPNLITGQVADSIPLGKETFERLMLGMTYVLGTMDPDTFVRARDAMIIADSFLYPADASDPDTTGQHRSLIERAWAAREVGVNAAPSLGGQQTISTRVSDFAAGQGSLGAPEGVSAELTSPSSVKVTWQPVAGAFGYEVLKRNVGKENQRVNPPLLGREYVDGDGTTDGYLHIDYVPASQTSYEDGGPIEGGNIPLGLKNPVGSEYVVRALSVNPNRQMGVSAYSAAASVPTKAVDVTDRLEQSYSNIVFGGGRTELDLRLRNPGVGGFDGTAYMPVAVHVVSISDPTVTVANADNAGSGQGGSVATFHFTPTLRAGQTSDARRLIFYNPKVRMFTFDAVVTARVEAQPAEATRYEPEPPPNLSNYELKEFTDVFTGIVPASDAGLERAAGVTYVDVPFTSKEKAIHVRAELRSSLGLPVDHRVDMDFYLLDAGGGVMASSETEFADEQVAAPIKGNTQYIFRVVGWAGAAQDFKITSTQTAYVLKSGGSGSSSALTAGGGTQTFLARYTVNPLTKSVSVQLVKALK
ncbi:MAG TPA: M36 family metallopeptidase [Pyrinomonadaceae bacterium]|nr:M36 family metallopeptidase [Pyrinomonadaceae bacterium]